VAGVSQSPAGRRGYGTLGHGLFPAAASPLQCPKIKKMFDQLLLVLGARKSNVSSSSGRIPLPSDPDILVLFALYHFFSRILSHGLGRFHSPAHRLGYGVAYCHMVFYGESIPLRIAREGDTEYYGNSIPLRLARDTEYCHMVFYGESFPLRIARDTTRILLQIGSYSSESHVVRIIVT